MANKIIVILAVLFSILLFAAGWFGHREFAEPITNTVVVTNTKEKIVYRDYAVMPQDLIVEKLKCYDTAQFKFNYSVLDSPSNEVRIINYYSLCDRNGSHELSLPISEGGDWKIYLGIGCAAGILLAAGTVYLVK